MFQDGYFYTQLDLFKHFLRLTLMHKKQKSE